MAHKKPAKSSSGPIVDWNMPAPDNYRPTPESMAQYKREFGDKDGVITLDLDPPTMTHEQEMTMLAHIPRAPRAPKTGP